MRILCGTDFSQHAVEAGRVAAILAARTRGKVALVHAMDVSRYELPSKELLDYLRSSRKKKLKLEADRLRHRGAEIEESFVEGSPATSLINEASKSGADLIVVGSLGQVASRGWLVGSVAERAAQGSSIPILVVRDPKPFETWTHGKQPLHVLVGYDFTASSDAAVRWAASLRDLGPCVLTVAYVAWPSEAVARLGLPNPASAHYWPSEVQKFLERDLRERCEEILGKVKVRICFATTLGRPDPQLIELAGTQRADLIVVGTNQRRGLYRLGSVSRGVLQHASINVACVPMSAIEDDGARSMPQFRRVLVPTDFSTWGNRAIALAYSVVRAGGEVCLVHVTAPTSRRTSDRSNQERQAERGRRAAAQLQALVPEAAEPRRVKSRTEVAEHTQPAIAICQAAERFDADLICLGSRGRSGLRKALLGSVAQAVMTQSKRPVLILRE